MVSSHVKAAWLQAIRAARTHDVSGYGHAPGGGLGVHGRHG